MADDRYVDIVEVEESPLTGLWFVNLKSSNGDTLFTSQKGFEEKASAGEAAMRMAAAHGATVVVKD